MQSDDYAVAQLVLYKKKPRMLIQDLTVIGRVIEIPNRLKLWTLSDCEQNLNFMEKKAMRADIYLFWSVQLNDLLYINNAAHATISTYVLETAAYVLAREEIKCLIDCSFNPPDWSSSIFYLWRAILRIAQYGTGFWELLPPKSKVKVSGQELFNCLVRSLMFIDIIHGQQLFLLLLRKSSDYPNSGWLLDFDFSAAEAPIAFHVIYSNGLLCDCEIVGHLLNHGMRVHPMDIICALDVLPDQEYIVFHELVKRTPKRFLHDILLDKVISRKINFAAIICVYDGTNMEKFMKLACSFDIYLSNLQQLAKVLTPKSRSKLFEKFCIIKSMEKSTLVLKSGSFSPNIMLETFKQHWSFILNDESLNLFKIFMKHSSVNINRLLEIFIKISDKKINPAKYAVALILVEEGGNINHLAPSKNSTAIHGAVELCLKNGHGDTKLLSIVCDNIVKKQIPQIERFTDTNLSSPYHLIAKLPEKHITAEVCDLLSSFNFIDPTSKDSCQKPPLYYAKKQLSETSQNAFLRAIAKWNDTHVHFPPPEPTGTMEKINNVPNVPNTSPQTIQRDENNEILNNNASLQTMQKDENNEMLNNNVPNTPPQTVQKDENNEIFKKRENETNELEIQATLGGSSCSNEQQCEKHGEVEVVVAHDVSTPAKAKCDLKAEILQQSLNQLIEFLLEKPLEYFVAAAHNGEEHRLSEDDERPTIDHGEEYSKKNETINKEEVVDEHIIADCPIVNAEPDDDDDYDFSSLPWEIFISKQAGDFLKASKTSEKVICDIKKKLKRIGEGERSKTICHKLIEPEYRLFETYLYCAARIIWCEDIQYSESKSNPEQNKIIYCDVVKIIWITLKHSTNQLNDVLQKIKISLEKSRKSIGRELRLQTKSHEQQDGFSYPRFFHPIDHPQQSEDIVRLHPIPNLYGGEFSIMQYHPFSEFLNALLNSDPSERECSIGMSQQEHEIIKLPYGKEAIILCGRSGTGKTTTCIYRMWNEFCAFWEQKNQEDETAADKCNSGEYLHQVFLTKSPVLCSQVKKEFDKLVKSCKKFKSSMFDRQSLKLSTNLSDCKDKMFPLFVTSKKLLFFLDSSLAGNTFFPRNEDGEFDVDFNFSDYSEDIDPESLFEDSEDEESSEGNSQTGLQKPYATEVNADYFCYHIWPKISNKDFDLDSLLVWTEIQSFIKGSMEAIESDKGYISRDEYKSLGKHFAPSFAKDDVKRDLCYDIFEKYCKYMAERKRDSFIFDENDLIFNIYKRLQLHNRKRNNPLKWHIDHFYIDEVQDFTQAEMCLLLRICRNPNNTFCTGDIAQSIMKGVFFRFEDLRTQFFKLAQTSKKKTIPVPRLLSLTENFRSHSGVLELAQSIVDILKKQFVHSFQDSKLPQEIAMFKGPEPVLLQTKSKEELVRVLLGNASDSSLPHELGAHQAIIVRSDNARKCLPKSLREGIVLTVLEAKGLEFNDVLLYNFFSDSQVKNQWRLLCNLVQEQQEQQNDSIDTLIMDKMKMNRLHPLRIDEKQEEKLKSLSAELKHLYTAITRARMNLWIYDEGTECEPFFIFCLVKKLARLVNTSDRNATSDNLMFAAPSPDEQWSKQGDYYFSSREWQLAITCYEKGKNYHKTFLVQGYKLVEEAHRTKSKHCYKKAAQLFLLANKSKHSIECIEKAITCFRKADCHVEAAKLLEKMQKFEKAALEWDLAGNNIDKVAELREKLKDYSGVVRCLARSGDYTKALIKAVDYSKAEIRLEEDVKPEQIAYEYICVKKGKKIDISEEEVLKLVSDGSVKATLLREAGRLEEAADEFLKIGHLDQACRILEAKCHFEKGYSMVRDEKTKAMFLLYHITTLLVASNWKKTEEINRKLMELGKYPFLYFQARSQILLGIIDRNGLLLKRAIENFKRYKSHPGVVLAFSSLKYLRLETTPDDDLCNSKTAYEIAESIDSHLKSIQCTFRQKSIYQEVLKVHDLKTEMDNESKYFISPFLLKHNICQSLHELANSSNCDEDGMLMLDKVKVNDILSSYYRQMHIEFLKSSSEHFAKQLSTKIKTSVFHAYLQGNHCENGLDVNLYNFFKWLKDHIEYCLLTNESSPDVLADNQILLKLFSPCISFCFSVTRKNLNFLVYSSFVKEYLKKIAMNILKDPESTIEVYLVIFRLLTVLVGRRNATEELTKVIRLPEAQQYVFEHERSGERIHVFKGWLITNDRIHNRNKDFTDAVWSVYNFFLKRVVNFSDECRKQAISIGSVSYITSVFSTALLIILNNANFIPVPVLIPMLYQHILSNFDNFNHRSIVSVCFDQLSKNDPKCLKKMLQQLNLLLSFLLGEDGSKYNILLTALTSESCIEDGSALFCLVQCLVLAANLYVECSVDEAQDIHAKLVNIHKTVRASNRVRKFCEESFVKKAINGLSSAKNIRDVFELISELLLTFNHKSDLVTPYLDFQSRTVKYDLVYRIYYPSIPIKSLVVIEIPDNDDDDSIDHEQENSTEIMELPSPSEELEALKLDESEPLHVATDEQQKLGSEISSDNFCIACGVMLHKEEGMGEDSEFSKSEDFRSHLQSTKHENNVNDYSEYIHIKESFEKKCSDLMAMMETLHKETSLMKLEALMIKLKHSMNGAQTLNGEMTKSFEWTNGTEKLRGFITEVQNYETEYSKLEDDCEKRKAVSSKPEEDEVNILPPQIEASRKLKRKTRKTKRN